MYIKIIGENEKYNVKLSPFTTQHGKRAVRFIGDEIPETDKGFMLYNDDEKEIGDLSSYKYQYRPNEYSEEQDEQILPSFVDTPLNPSAIDRLNSRINRVSAQVSEITPYEQTKTAYHGEIEKVFYGVPNGVLTVTFDKYDGEYEVSRTDDRITVSFPRLEDSTNITIMVQ